jgi:hypothetical protein
LPARSENRLPGPALGDLRPALLRRFAMNQL